MRAPTDRRSTGEPARDTQDKEQCGEEFMGKIEYASAASFSAWIKTRYKTRKRKAIGPPDVVIAMLSYSYCAASNRDIDGSQQNSNFYSKEIFSSLFIYILLVTYRKVVPSISLATDTKTGIPTRQTAGRRRGI